MEWLLLIVMLTAEDELDLEPALFETKTACEAAARAFVKEYPEFEWRGRPGGGGVFNPVVRPHVECVAANAG